MTARKLYRVTAGGRDEEAEVTLWLSEAEAAVVEYIEDEMLHDVAGVEIREVAK